MKKTRTSIILLSLIIAMSLATGTLAGPGDLAGNQLQLPQEFGPQQAFQDWNLLDGDGTWVVQIYFEDRQQVNELASWLDLWEVRHDEGYLVTEVTRFEYEQLLAQGYRVEVDEKLTELINRPMEYLPGQISGIPGFPCYRTVEETFDSAVQMTIDYPDLTDWIDIGDSWEKTEPGGEPGYDLMVLVLTNKNITGEKPILFIMAAIHAREYTTAELATRYAEHLLQNYGSDADITWLLDQTEIHILLQSNPDGRKKAESGLSWRKNTNNNYCANTNDRGADLNRNYTYKWGCCGGSSSNPCAATYRGPSEASEPETQAVESYVKSIFPDQRGPGDFDAAPPDATGLFLDLHSYSRLVLWPWGWTYSPSPNATAFTTLGRKFAYFNGYTPQQSSQLYITDGTTDSVGYGELGVASYTFELGNSFFESCEAFENTIYPDNLPALIYAAKASRLPYMEPGGPDALNVSTAPVAAAPGQEVILSALIDDTRFNNSNGTEPVQNIVEAEYYINIPPWEDGAEPTPMSAADGSFNSPVEEVTATLDTSGLSIGQHIIYVRGKDALGNWGVPSATFLYLLDPESAPIIQGYVRSAADNTPVQAQVSAGIFNATSEPDSGFYSMQVFSGTYTLEVSAVGFASASLPGIEAIDYQTTYQNIYLEPICAIFSDDVEDGNQGWTPQTPWGITTQYAHSPTHSWTDSPAGNYGNYANTSLTSQIFDLSDFSEIRLEFWHRYDIEAGYDYGRVEYSPDGSSWYPAATYTGTSLNWSKASIALPGLDGMASARVRFRLTSDSWITADGWYIDDIVLVDGAGSCIEPLSPLADFTYSSPAYEGQPVAFTDMTVGTPPLEYVWDFGDGIGASTDSDPFYTYPDPGVYTVTLTVSNDLGEDTIAKPVLINSIECVPITSVELSQQTDEPIRPGDLVTYQALLHPEDASPPFYYEVDFGDGLFWNDADPVNDNPILFTHSFEAPGSYTVEFSATNCGIAEPFVDSLVTVVINENITLIPSEASLEAAPGEKAVYALEVANLGDTVIDVTLSLGESDWLAELSSNLLEDMLPGESASFTVTVDVPVGALYLASDSVAVTAAIEGSPRIPASASLTTLAGAVAGLSANLPEDDQAGFPGSELTYLLEITNTGNFTESYQIVYTSTWESAVWLGMDEITSGGTIDLGPGENQELMVIVAVPEDAGNGASDQVELAIIPQSGEPPAREFILKAWSIYRKLFLPVMVR
jgi:carboxypeptidase T